MTDPYAETDDWPTVPATRPADLRAEVERLRALADVYLEEHDKQHARAEAAEAESARLASEQRELAAQVAGLRSVVAAVEAACTAAENGSGPMQTKPSGYVPVVIVRAALASVGVSGSADDRREANASQAPDTATPGEADEWCEWCRHLREHHPSDGGCVRGDPGEGWRCACTQYRPAATPTAEAGGE